MEAALDVTRRRRAGRRGCRWPSHARRMCHWVHVAKRMNDWCLQWRAWFLSTNDVASKGCSVYVWWWNIFPAHVSVSVASRRLWWYCVTPWIASRMRDLALGVVKFLSRTTAFRVTLYHWHGAHSCVNWRPDKTYWGVTFCCTGTSVAVTVGRCLNQKPVGCWDEWSRSCGNYVDVGAGHRERGLPGRQETLLWL